MIELITANSAADHAAAGILFREYAAWLGIDLGFQHFDEELQQLREMYGAPQGGILLYKDGGNYIGCAAVRNKGNGIAELKRMYIQPAYQGKGLGPVLLNKALELAAALGYEKIRLDTLDTMLPAMNLYTKAGFYRIDAYYHNPQPGAVYFEKLLK